jgi:hypothetical protein
MSDAILLVCSIASALAGLIAVATAADWTPEPGKAPVRDD